MIGNNIRKGSKTWRVRISIVLPYEMEEVQDNEEEDQEDTQSSTQTRVVTSRVTWLLRQLTLPESLKPQRQFSSSPSIS
jgi:hypothetical protein